MNDAPETVYITGKEQDVITVEFENYSDGGLIIRKLDSETKQPLAGAEFKVTTANGTVVDNYGGTVSSNGIYTTDTSGQIHITGIEAGTTLVVTETKAPDGYVLETMSQTVTINKSDVQTLTFYNEPDSGLLITKLDKRTGDALYGAVFKITTDEGTVVGNSNGRYTTDRNGQIHLTGLATDTYIVTEVTAPEGYSLDTTPQTIKLKSGETSELTFYNEAVGGIRITKVDEEKESIWNRILSYISGSVTPALPVLIGSGMISAILALCANLLKVDTAGTTHQLFNTLANAAYTYLPVLVAFAAARRLKALFQKIKPTIPASKCPEPLIPPRLKFILWLFTV